MKIRELPISVQTVYVDLVEKAWTGDRAQLAAGPGAPYRREAGGRAYWYWQPATGHGRHRPPARYVGPDNETTRKRLAAMNDKATGLRERRDMVRSLRGARLPYPDTLTGDVLAAMAEAGVFRLRAVLVGSVAFQSYIGILGVRLPASLSRTGDVDFAQFHAIALAVDDEIDRDLEDVLKAVDKRFTAILDPMDSRRTLRYALRVGKEERFSVDMLRPLRGPERGRIARLRALRSHAQLLRFLDFLLYQEVNAVALHGAGIPINVPDPTRFALHKLLLSQMCIAIPRNQKKAKKDLEQAEALITVLARQRPGDLKDLWEDLKERGPSWSRKADRSLLQLSEETRALLEG